MGSGVVARLRSAVQLVGEIATAPGRLAALATHYAWLSQTEARARAAATAAGEDAREQVRAAERRQWAVEQREAVTARALAAALARAEDAEAVAKQVPELRRKVATAEALLEGTRRALAESERYGEKMRSAAEDEQRIARECRRREQEAEGRARAALRLAQRDGQAHALEDRGEGEE